MRSLGRVGYFLGLPALLLTVWWGLTRHNTNLFVPQPLELFRVFGQVWFGPRFAEDIVPSVLRLLIGVGCAALVGISLGAVIGRLRGLRLFLEPLLEFFRALPPPVLVPVLMLFFGINDQMKILVIISGCLWPILLNTVAGVRALDEVLQESARVYGLTRWARTRYLILPGAGPQIMAGIRQSLAIGLILMVISEMFASSSGLGFTIVQFQRSFAITEMWSGIVVLGLIGLTLTAVFQLVEQRTLRWYAGLKEEQRND